MENASKALLIAGGVLIAMLVASLGVYFAKSFSEETARIYEQMESSKRTEFNQQFIAYDTAGEVRLSIQDVVSLINLAKDSNKKNELTDSMAPAVPADDTSMYVTVNINEKINIEKYSDNDINNLLNNEAKLNTHTQTLYKCSIIRNKHTGYVNLIEISG